MIVTDLPEDWDKLAAKCGAQAVRIAELQAQALKDRASIAQLVSQIHESIAVEGRYKDESNALTHRIAALAAENATLRKFLGEMTANNIRLHEKFSPLEAENKTLKAAAEEAETRCNDLDTLFRVNQRDIRETVERALGYKCYMDALNAVRRLADRYHKEADNANEAQAKYDTANARADAAEKTLTELRAKWPKVEAHTVHWINRAESAEAEAARPRGVLQKVEAYLSSEESPLHTLWENGAICAYNETPCETWREVVAQLRDFKIPADCLGYGVEWAAVTLYREIYAALQEGREGGPK